MKLYRRNKQIKNFIERYAIISGTDTELLSVGICEKHLQNGGIARFYYDCIDDKMKNFKIKVSPTELRQFRIKEGYSNYYYNGRHEKLSFVLNNFKLCYRFVLLHELGHIKFYQKYCNYKVSKYRNYTTKQKEKYADNFALRYLNISYLNNFKKCGVKC